MALHVSKRNFSWAYFFYSTTDFRILKKKTCWYLNESSLHQELEYVIIIVIQGSSDIYSWLAGKGLLNSLNVSISQQRHLAWQCMDYMYLFIMNTTTVLLQPNCSNFLIHITCFARLHSELSSSECLYSYHKVLSLVTGGGIPCLPGGPENCPWSCPQDFPWNCQWKECPRCCRWTHTNYS